MLPLTLPTDEIFSKKTKKGLLPFFLKTIKTTVLNKSKKNGRVEKF